MKWKIATLGEIATIERKGIDASDIVSGTEFIGLEHIQIGGEIIGSQCVENGEISSTKFHFSQAHVLYGKLRPYLAKIALPDFEGICSTDILPISPGPNLDRRYLAYYLRQPSMVDFANSRSTGANLPRLSPKVLATFQIPLPPLEEQRRIAAILDKADGVRRKRKAAIALTEDLLRSTFLDMFGDPVTNPKGWEIKYLEDFTEIQSGIAKGKKVDESDAISVPYMRVANVQDGYVDLSEVKEIKVRNIDVVKYCLRKGDILLTEGGDPDKLGRGAVWQGQIQPCIHQNHIFCVRPNNQFAESEYLSAIIGSQYGKQYFLRAAKQTTGIATINKSQLRKFPALIPPLSLQKRYVQLLNEIFMTRQRIKAASTEIDNLFNSLLQRAFRGDL